MRRSGYSVSYYEYHGADPSAYYGIPYRSVSLFLSLATQASSNKPKMINAPEGLSQVILRKVRRFRTFVCQKRSFFIMLLITFKIMTHHSTTLTQLITSSPSLMPTISTRCAFSYIAIWIRKPRDK